MIRGSTRRPCRTVLIASLISLISATALADPPYPTEFRSEEEARGYLPRDLPLKPVGPRRHEPTGRLQAPVVRRVLHDGDAGPVVQQGSLSGVSVYLSPGHGWTYTSSTGWATQRGNTHGIVEDLSNVDMVGQFLVPYLLNAGALVVPVREIDATVQMVILDNSDGAKNPARGKYYESGAAFSDSTLKGWGHPTLPITGSVNPFTAGGNRLVKTSTTETARATFVPNVPAAGYYNLYLSHSMYSGRPSDARVTVVHPGGKTVYLVNQRRHGGTWVLLGRFYFEKGQDEARGAVVFSNQSKDAGSFLSVDAVRLGGGSGLMNRGGGTSKFARADECSRYHAQFAGAPSTVYDPSTGDDRTDDVSTRSRFADWAHSPGEPAVYISHHTNAYKGSARGIVSFIYGKNPVDGAYKPTATTLALGSDKLAFAVHEMMVADIRKAWDPVWQDRKVKSAYFGELNTANQDEMAAMLIETAFHDNVTDAAALKEAAFRRIVGRAITKGIVKYFAQKNGVSPLYLPEPPRAVVARNTGAGKVVVSWSAPQFGGALGHAASSYRVYRGTHGLAFDNGTDTKGKTSLTLSGLPPGKVLYVRVTAVNKGGESLPCPTLAVGVAPSATQAPALLVSGADRWDAKMNLRITYPRVKTVDRLFVERINHGTYLVQHGKALGPAKAVFDACTHDAVDSGVVKPSAYQLVIWQSGKGVVGGRGLSTASRAALAQAASAGRSLIVSGTQVARTLGASAAVAADKSFLGGGLRASYVSSSGTFGGASPATGSALAGLGSWTLATQTAGPYDVQAPDVINPAGGALAAQYAVGKGAATQYSDGKRCAVLLGFPLEAVLPAQRQAEIMARLISYCKVTMPRPPDGQVQPTDGPMKPTDGTTKPGDGPFSSPDGGPPPADAPGPAGDAWVEHWTLHGGCSVSQSAPPLWVLFLVLLLWGVRQRR